MFKLIINGVETFETISKADIRNAASITDRRIPVRIMKKGKPCLGLMAQAGVIQQKDITHIANRLKK